MHLTLKASGTDFFFKDAGVLIENAGSSFDTDPNMIQILAKSAALRALVIAGTVIVNDGNADLAALAGQQYLVQLWLMSGNDVSPQFSHIEGTASAGQIGPAHEAIRQLIHFVEDGPAEGFDSGAYREQTGTVFPSSIIWYDKSGVGKKKIVEKTITWTGANPTTIVWKVYDTSETLLATVTDTITYSGPFETSRTRTIA
jgi:hypothetical protein